MRPLVTTIIRVPSSEEHPSNLILSDPHPLMSAAAAVATRLVSAFSERHGVDLECGRAYPRSKLFELLTEILKWSRGVDARTTGQQVRSAFSRAICANMILF